MNATPTKGMSKEHQAQLLAACKVAPESQPGLFLLLIQLNRMDLYFDNMPFGRFTKQCALQELSADSFKDLDPLYHDINTLTKTNLRPIKSFSIIGEVDKVEKIAMVKGLMSGLATIFNPERPQDTAFASVPFLIYDLYMEKAYVSMFHKKEYLNVNALDRLNNTLKLNNLLEVAHYSNTRQITSITEDFIIEELGLEYFNAQEQSYDVSGDEPMIKQEKWVAFRGRGYDQKVVYTCFICNTASTEKCSCPTHDLRTVESAPCYILQEDDED